MLSQTKAHKSHLYQCKLLTWGNSRPNHAIIIPSVIWSSVKYRNAIPTDLLPSQMGRGDKTDHSSCPTFWNCIHWTRDEAFLGTTCPTWMRFQLHFKKLCITPLCMCNVIVNLASVRFHIPTCESLCNNFHKEYTSFFSRAYNVCTWQ